VQEHQQLEVELKKEAQQRQQLRLEVDVWSSYSSRKRHSNISSYNRSSRNNNPSGSWWWDSHRDNSSRLHWRESRCSRSSWR